MRIAKIIILLAAGIIFVTPLFLPDLFYGQKEESVQGDVVPSPLPSLIPSPTLKLRTDNKEIFLNDLSNFVSLQEAKFGIEVLELDSGERFGINQEQKFHAASTGKVLVAVYALKKVDEGQLNLDQIFGGVPLKERLRLMINISDNNSWEILLNGLNYSKIQKFGEEQGLSNSDVYQNTTTAHGLNTLLSKLYKREILSSQSTDLLLSWMQNTEREDLIPSAISKDIQVYHKAGSFNGETHDTAIIIHPKKPFVLSILSDGSQERSAVIRTIVQKVYQFEDQK